VDQVFRGAGRTLNHPRPRRWTALATMGYEVPEESCLRLHGCPQLVRVEQVARIDAVDCSRSLFSSPDRHFNDTLIRNIDDIIIVKILDNNIHKRYVSSSLAGWEDKRLAITC
jgi:hypothetical protein